MTTDWFQNDALFLRECAEGHKWERYVVGLLTRDGLKASCPKQTLRDHVSQAHQYLQDSDVVVEVGSGRELVFEVKSRRVKFKSPADFPYDDVFVDTVSGWDAKEPRPVGVICVSQVTHSVMVLPAGTQPKWERERRYDHVRGFETDFYVASRELWGSYGSLVKRLKQLK